MRRQILSIEIYNASETTAGELRSLAFEEASEIDPSALQSSPCW